MGVCDVDFVVMEDGLVGHCTRVVVVVVRAVTIGKASVGSPQYCLYWVAGSLR